MGPVLRRHGPVALPAALAIAGAQVSCGAGSDWVEAADGASARREHGGKAFVDAREPPRGGGSRAAWKGLDVRSTPADEATDGVAGPGDGDGADGAAPVVIRSHGAPLGKSRSLPRTRTEGRTPEQAPQPGVFRNTYYDFPVEGGGRKERMLFDASCKPIANVTREFHDQVCVQGSGRIATGATVSFAKRGCSCAELCPRTAQRICFERLDERRFPHGRGALGTAIVPLRSVAVDSSVVPLGSTLYIPEFDGAPRADGTRHDGCFLAEDRGLRVQGRHVDVFAGTPDETRRLSQLVPSNRGVHVRVGDPKCRLQP